MKSYTDIEQSKKLAEFLPIESADMRYAPFVGDTHPWVWNEEVKLLEKGSVPCWSLAALLNVLPHPSLHRTSLGWRCDTSKKDGYTIKMGDYTDNPVDTCYEMILKLHELNLL